MKQLEKLQQVVNAERRVNEGCTSLSSHDNLSSNEAVLKEQIIKTLTKENLIQAQKQAKLETLICVQEDLVQKNESLSAKIENIEREKAELK